MKLIWLLFLLVRTSFAFKSLAALEEEESSRSLSRQRRFLIPSLKDWQFTVRFSLKWPLQGLDTSMDANVPFSYKFDLSSIGRKKRDASKHFTDRERIFKNMENYMPALVSLPPGVSSHDCVLRAICEVARTPENEDGIMGDMVNLLLTPTHVLDKTTIESDYLDAQRTGHFFQNCYKFESKCPVSLFECFEDEFEPSWPSIESSNSTNLTP